MKNKLTVKKAFFLFNTSLVFIVIFLVTLLLLSSEIANHRKKIKSIVTDATNEQKNQLKQKVDHLIDYIDFKVNLDANTSTEDLQNEILRYIESVRFSYGGYVFVNHLGGTALLFDGKIVKEPKNILNLTDPNGLRIFDMEIDAYNNPDGGYIEYLFKKMDTEIPEPKISYINGYKDWNWIIGAGNYKLDLTTELKTQNSILVKSLYRKVFTIVLLFIIIAVIILLFGNYVSRLFQNQFALIDNLFLRSLGFDAPSASSNENKFILKEIESFIKKIEFLIKQKDSVEIAKLEIEEKFSKAFFDQVIPITIVNVNTGERTNVNKTFLTFFEFEDVEIDEDNIYTNSIWIDADDQKKAIESLVKNRYIKNWQAEMKTRTGKIKNVLVNASMLDIADGNLSIVSLVDITEQKQATELAKKNEEYFRTMIEQSPIGTQIVDTNGLIQSVNEAWCKIWGINDLSSIINQLIISANAEAIDVDLVPYIEKALSGESIEIPEVQFILNRNTENPKELYLRIRTYPLKQADGTFNSIVILNEDITENKIAKLKLKDLNEELASQNEEYLSLNEELIESINEVGKINIQLEKAKIKAEESDLLKTEFINNLSHEIRTPMNGILGFSNFLSDPELAEGTRNQYVSIIQNSGNQLMKIIDDILEISKLGTKQVKVVKKEVCINNLMLELFSIFDIRAKENKIPLYLKKGLSDERSCIFTDEVKLSKILNNLLENALNFTNKGFIEIGYKLISNEKDETQWLRFYVKDTGIGIKPEKQKNIFNRFSQVENGLSRNFGGLGLGLSIAKENTALLGGKISVHSIKGEGSTFFIDIPYHPVNETIKPLLAKKINTVLVAEDEEINFMYLETLLKERLELNIHILHAKNGKEAIELCEKFPEINLVLMDIKMPIIDGNEAAAAIKKCRPELPIIAQTAYTTSDYHEKSRIAGCVDFISKPISREAINTIIDRYISE